jgi:hypothetical protein
MTLNCQGGLMVPAHVTNGGRPVTRLLPPRCCLRTGPSWQEGPAWARLVGFVLACLVLPAFCLGLIALAVLPSLEIAVPRWLILVYGAGCVLLAVLAVLLRGPWHEPESGQSERSSCQRRRPAGPGLTHPLARLTNAASASRAPAAVAALARGTGLGPGRATGPIYPERWPRNH